MKREALICDVCNEAVAHDKCSLCAKDLCHKDSEAQFTISLDVRGGGGAPETLLPLCNDVRWSLCRPCAVAIASNQTKMRGRVVGPSEVAPLCTAVVDSVRTFLAAKQLGAPDETTMADVTGTAPSSDGTARLHDLRFDCDLVRVNPNERVYRKADRTAFYTSPAHNAIVTRVNLDTDRFYVDFPGNQMIEVTIDFVKQNGWDAAIRAAQTKLIASRLLLNPSAT